MVAAVENGRPHPAISGQDRAMMEFSVLLTRQPDRVRRKDLESLRLHGFSDPALLDIAQIAAYFNFVNRMAQGLGVELEARWGKEDR